MENIGAPIPEINLISETYDLNINNEPYNLLIGINQEENIYFNLRKINASLVHYFNKYSYEDIIDLFLLINKYYTNFKKIIDFLDKSIQNKKISLTENKYNNYFLLKLKRIIDFDEVEKTIELKPIKLS